MRLGVRSTFGMLLLGFASVVLLGEIVALMDPAGTQLANDAKPAGWQAHVTSFGVIAALAAAGWWLLLGGRRRRNTPTHQRNRG